MGRSSTFKSVVNSLKDKASIIKATLMNNRGASFIRIAVLRATTHDYTAPPSETGLADLLALGRDSRSTARACIEALVDRLHRTRSATVALKCLFVLHNFVTRGSFVLRDQLSVFPSYGGRHLFKFSTFRDESDSDMREFSAWVRWYAGIVEKNLSVSREFGYHFRSTDIKEKENTDLTLGIDILVDFVELISETPENLNLQRNDLIYEVVKMAAENYRLVQREIFVQVKEVGDRLEELSERELTEWLRSLERFESCRERLVLLFANKAMNQRVWELIRLTKMKMEKTKEATAAKRLALVLVGKRPDSGRVNSFLQSVLGSG